MEKYLITFSSSNPITGPIMVTTSPRGTCPSVCPLRKPLNPSTLCYAERGHLGGFIWTGLDRYHPGTSFGNGIKVYGRPHLLAAIRSLLRGSVWRHNQAGDLYCRGDYLDIESIRAITTANTHRRGFAFTHHDVLDNFYNRGLVAEANAARFRINLSANTLEHADALVDLAIAPVTVIVPSDQTTNLKTPKGRTVVICPARTRKGITCSTCQLCTRNRQTIVGLPTLTGKEQIY